LFISMPAAPHPPDEGQRLQDLIDLEVLDTGPEHEFDALVRAAALVCGVPISLISLVDADRQWFKANVGLDGVAQTPRELAFCAHAIAGDEILEVPDARHDPRFADNALVTGSPDIRFYAGVPLKLQGGSRVGTICVIDRQPRQLDAQQREVLGLLARAASMALEGRRALRHERRQREAEARAAAVLAHSADAVITLGADGLVTSWNASAERLFGHTAAEMVGATVERLIPPYRRHSEGDAILQLCAQPGGQSYETVRLHRDGHLIPVSVSLGPILDPQQRLIGCAKIVRDIREQARSAQALAESEARFRVLSDNSPVGVFATDRHGAITYTNARWQGIFGMSLADSLGNGWAAVLHPEDRAEVCTAWQRAVQQPGSSDMEFRIRRPGGAIRHVHARAAPVAGLDGKADGFVGTVDDVTEQHATRAALDDERVRMASIITGTDAGTWEWNLRTGETRFNERWARIIGCTLAELGATSYDTWAAHAHPDDLAHAHDMLQRHFAGEVPAYTCEMRMRHREGHWVWVLTRGRVLTWTAAGRPEWMFGTHLDITLLKRQEEALRQSEQLLNRTGQVAGIGGWALDLRSRRLTWSAQTFRLHGLPEGPEPGLQEALAFYTSEGRARLREVVAQAMARRTGWDLELPLTRADGQTIWVRAVGETEREGDQVVRLVGALQDITEARRLRTELAEQHELLRVTLRSIGDAVITTDAHARVTWMNPAAERMTGWPTDAAKGRHLGQVFCIVNEDSRAPTENPVIACLQQGKTAGLASRTLLISRDGAEYGIEDSAAPIRNDGGELLGAVLVFHDVTEQRRLSGEMSWRASHDALTGLVNRAEFEIRLRRILHRAHEERSTHALLYIDLDQFKLVNDACGHSVGDQLLQQISRLLSDAVRTRDTLARLGGDEFGVILEHCTVEQAQRVAQIVCERMEDFRFVHQERRFRIGASIGLVPVDTRWSSIAAVMQAADASCYAAKEGGRNRVHAWFDSDQAIRARHGEMQWAARLEQALDENRFALFAQRIHALSPPAMGAGLHVEVLLRLVDHDGQLVAPGAFLPAAERFQLASRIDRWVLRHVIEALRPTAADPPIDLVCVNLSGQSIGDRAFHRHAIEAFRNAGPALCRKLCLEITETVAVTNLADASAFIEQARALGVRVALDDFGAGASSFGYLKHLKVDLLKIDGSFIRDLLEDPLDNAAVRCFTEVARVLEVQTVAEFVDRPELLTRVREIGIDHAQGFLLHRPEPLDQVLRPSAHAIAATGAESTEPGLSQH